MLPRVVHSRFGLHVVEVLEPGVAQPLEAVHGAVRFALRQYLQVLAGNAVVEGVDLDAAATPLRARSPAPAGAAAAAAGTGSVGLSERSVFVGATGGHFASKVSIERLRRLNPPLNTSLHSVSFLQPIHRLVAKLNLLAPTIIANYPSAAGAAGSTSIRVGRLPCALT